MILLLIALGISGCASQRASTKSSVMDYLYPKTVETYVEPSIPNLTIPLRVGIAFVPESTSGSYAQNFWTGKQYSSALTEAHKNQLLQQVADNFKELDVVSDIEVIPTAYLTPQGSFANLEQIKTMYGIDVIALVSYDQVQFTDESMLSLSYWTIVGAYVVSGEKNDTSTLIDTVVYDIDSKKLLFRAPGTSKVVGSATPINLSQELRADSLEGFEQATNAMIGNLKLQLEKFKASLKSNPETANVTFREGYRGGALGGLALTFMVFFIALFRKK
ncbi:rhombotarget lipoprotein [Thalassotalea maritima]|uniref:rhombotarget lipoprotein n=1 Tax=Thalassotalea maritima TaxID=3242416 RepID=UPI003528982A